MEHFEQIKSIYPSPPSMPSLTNGTEGCPGFTALSISFIDQSSPSTSSWGRVGWECQEAGPRAKSDIVFDLSLPFLLTFHFSFRLWNPKSWTLGREYMKEAEVVGWLKRQRWAGETGTFSGVAGNQETWLFALGL